MPKSLIVDPAVVRVPLTITTPDIPANQYTSDVDAERALYGDSALVDMLRDMIVIRRLDTMLSAVKTNGEWNGVRASTRGGTHLAVGQEASAVGQAAALELDDQIFGSHRNHGETLAKTFSVARRLDPAVLEQTMKEFQEGRTLLQAEKASHTGLVDLAENFLLFGMVAEIFGRSAGLNSGLGGSMHTFFAPFGSMPNNAIVGGQAPMALGAALFKRINERPGIVVANIGDASLGCGPVWESMNFAAMAQFRDLWRASDGGNPPILFNAFNNFYGMGSQTAGETMGADYLVRAGAGINAEAMHAERVDGYDPLAVADAVRRKRQLLVEGRGPALMDTVVYRTSGHGISDASTYRTREEIELWEQADPILGFAAKLIAQDIIDGDFLANTTQAIDEKLAAVLRLAADDDLPRASPQFIEGVTFSGTAEMPLADGVPELLEPLEANAQVQSVGRKVRSAYDADGTEVSAARVFSFRHGLFEALAHGFANEPTMAAWGEENRDWGGAFAVYRGLTELLPYRRLFNSPISEAAIVGAGVGYALSGGRAVVELMYCDFVGRSGDEIFNQAAKWQAMSGGQLKMPLVIRVTIGQGYGAQHSQDWSALVGHVPGLKVFFPVTPADAKGMMNLALSLSDPVIFIETESLYGIGEQFEPGGVPEGYYLTPEGEPAVRRTGTDVTIATLGAPLYRALEAADILATDHGISAEVIDLRFVAPLNYDSLIDSVRKTGRLVLAADAVERGSFMHTVASNVQTLAFEDLDAPVAVVGAPNRITPGPESENEYTPQASWIIDTIHERVLPLPGHSPAANFTRGEITRRTRLGV